MKPHHANPTPSAFSGLTREQLGRESDEWILKCLALENQEDAAREWDAFVQEEAGEEEAFSRPQLDQAVRGMIQQRHRRQMLRRLGRGARKTVLVAACFLCVMSMGLTTLFCTVDAVRLNVVELVMRTTKAYTSFNLQSLMGDQLPQNVAVNYESCPRPTWIPAGYQPSDSYGSEAEFYQIYVLDGEETFLSYNCMSQNTSLSLDTEDCTQEEVSINGNRGFAYQKYTGPYKGAGSVVWYDDQYLYLITVPPGVSYREMLRMAKSVR